MQPMSAGPRWLRGAALAASAVSAAVLAAFLVLGAFGLLLVVVPVLALLRGLRRPPAPRAEEGGGIVRPRYRVLDDA